MNEKAKEKAIYAVKVVLIVIGIILMIAIALILFLGKHYFTSVFSMCVNMFLLEKLADVIDL